MKFITYDEFCVTINANQQLTKEDQKDLRRLCCFIASDLKFYVEDELIPDHLKKKVKVIIK